MSHTQFIFLKKAKIPTRSALQASIDQLGFDLQLDSKLDLINDSGFSPCVLSGIPEVGFELMSGTPEAVFGEVPEFAGDNDYCIGLTWRGSMNDCAAVMITSCAFAQDFGAIVSYEGEPPEPIEKLLDGAREILQETLSDTEKTPRGRKRARRNLDRAVIRKRFAEVLVPHGFSCARSRNSTFHRALPGEIFHFIVPSFFQRRPVYDVMVFFNSPLIDPDFHKYFPDGGSLTDNCYLRPGHGIERHGSQFGCKDKKAFEVGFEKAVRPALETIAIPYLDRVRTLADMIPMMTQQALVEQIERAIRTQQIAAGDVR